MSIFTDDTMEELLHNLGFSKKEAKVYLALLEFGTQPASVISKKTGFPKATVLFLFGKLVKKGYLRKSKRGIVQYFYADPSDLKKSKEKEVKMEQESLEKILPLLKEFKNPYTSQPKLTFFEGIEGCKRAYSMLLESSTEILEFATHDDLVNSFGNKFMEDFMKERAKRKIMLKAICAPTKTQTDLSKRNKKQHRQTQFYNDEKGTIYSSITVFEDKVLLLSLYQDAFAILIENQQVAETLKTIFRISWKI